MVRVEHRNSSARTFKDKGFRCIIETDIYQFRGSYSMHYSGASRRGSSAQRCVKKVCGGDSAVPSEGSQLHIKETTTSKNKHHHTTKYHEHLGFP
jgi:hypothetical protein